MSNKSSELQGLNHLLTEATVGVINLVEATQKRIVHPPMLPSTPIQHLITNVAGIAFKGIRKSMKFVGNGLDKVLMQLAPALGNIKATKEKEAIVSVLNGVIGDYLEKKENPLKIAMKFRAIGKELSLDPNDLKTALPAINGKILLMVHGSCMNDIQWTQKDHNHATLLAEELDKTSIYLHYNSGLHISTNGQNFNDLIEELIVHWPVPIEELVILAHSMGGLVIRSAIYYGQLRQKTWTKHLKKIVFLGTPHHGATLERVGNYLDVILETIPYTKPFARLGKIRSAGITDLRYGYLLDEDWENHDRFEVRKNSKRKVPLPKQIECYSIAANVREKTNSLPSKLIGDRLVTVNSALGIHKDPDKDLQFIKENTWIAHESTHLDLLSSSKVYSKIKDWLQY